MLPNHEREGRRVRSPKVLAINNENPDWPEEDKRHGQDAFNALLAGLDDEGYTYQGFTFFDDLTFLDEFDPREWLVWNWGEELAGRPWSDAEVADELEQRGFAYTGGTPALIRLSQDRLGVKRQLQAAGLPTLPAIVIAQSDGLAEWSAYPAIVKGASQHGSVGIDADSVVETRAELARRVVFLRETYRDAALVEPFLDTREFHVVAVWGNAAPEALPPAELVYSHVASMRDRLYTEASKNDSTSRGYASIRMECPAPLDRPDWRARLEEVAVSAYRVLGLRDYARFDMRMLDDEPQILDVNVNPDLLPGDRSVFVAAAKARGIEYARMISTIIELAAVRMRD